jgi:outer membrane protein assembly factor BamD
MKIRLLWILAAGSLLLANACKSNFEQIRLSGDPKKIYESANTYYNKGDYQRAQTLYELIIGAFRGQPEAEEIYFKYADTYFQLEQYILASYYFKNFSNTFSLSEKREKADFMSAFCNFKLSPTFRLDQTYTKQAIDGFQLFVNTYPNSERVVQCNQLIIELRSKLERKAFEQGKLYYNLRQYQAAMHSLDNLLKDFPDTDNSEEIRFLILRSAYKLAENSIITKQDERYAEALEKAEEYLSRYSDSKHAKEAANIRDASLENLKDYDYDGYQNPSARLGS